VPATDFDFEEANAKFNKEDLIKEAIATGSPVGTPGEAGSEPQLPAYDAANGTNGAAEGGGDRRRDVVIPPAAPQQTYNKSSSFFDNISSELKDREDARGTGPAMGAGVGVGAGGREFRNAERSKNLETFGQGSVDSYRGGLRGRGRGRGRGFGRGRGGVEGFRGRGGLRGRGVGAEETV